MEPVRRFYCCASEPAVLWTEFSFLAAFPAEAEFVFPPCTYLAPTGRAQTLRVDDATSPAIDVQSRWVYFET